MKRRLSSHQTVALLATLIGLQLVQPNRPALSHTPKSPVVNEMVDKAIPFLEKNEAGMPGGKALVAMALLKSGVDASHPRVREAITACHRLAADVAREGVGNDCYNEMVACIFLCELDAQQHRAPIEDLFRGLLARQRRNGCWGYKSHSYDDTSQTQYGALCLWAVHTSGVHVPTETVGRVFNWLMRTQDVDGGWCYRATDPGQMQRVEQQEPTTHSMSAAGLGSIYIAAHLLGFGNRVNKRARVAGMPAALRRVDTPNEPGQFMSSDGVSYPAFEQAASLGNAWFARNMTFDFPKWTHYFMYGLERYKSFQELVEGNSQPEPMWYNQGVEFLRQTQKPDGSWKSQQPPRATAVVDTAFAVLFLQRSTQRSIGQNDEGRLRAGKGLPDDLTQIGVDRRGKVVNERETPPIDDLLKMLEDPDNQQSEFLDDVPQELDLGDDPQQRAKQIARLRRMASSGSFQARLTAVKTLGRDRDLDNVPALIFALSDPDARIQKGARDGLRFISRKLDGFGMPEQPKRQQWLDAQKKWRQWYLSIRPGGALIE